MAGKLRKYERAPWNPLACSDTAMTPNTLIAAKLAALFLVVDGFLAHVGPPFAPVLVALDALRAVPGYSVMLPGLFVVLAACLWLNRAVRIASTGLGLVVVLVQLHSLPAISGHRLLLGALLVLAGLEPVDARPVLLRWQMAAAYLFAFIGQATNPAWLDGSVLDSWMQAGEAHPALNWIARQLPSPWLAAGLAWAVMVAQLLVAVGLAIPWRSRMTVWFGILVQWALLVLFPTGPMLAFSIATGIGYLAFLNWPLTAIRALWPRGCGWPLWLRIVFDRYDWDHRIVWPQPPDPDAELEVSYDAAHARDLHAVREMLLYFPAFYFAGFGLALLAYLFLEPGFGSIVVLAISGIGFAFCSIPPFGRILKRLRQNR